jgi:hypothetical protein
MELIVTVISAAPSLVIINPILGAEVYVLVMAEEPEKKSFRVWPTCFKKAGAEAELGVTPSELKRTIGT